MWSQIKPTSHCMSPPCHPDLAPSFVFGRRDLLRYLKFMDPMAFPDGRVLTSLIKVVAGYLKGCHPKNTYSTLWFYMGWVDKVASILSKHTIVWAIFGVASSMGFDLRCGVVFLALGGIGECILGWLCLLQPCRTEADAG